MRKKSTAPAAPAVVETPTPPADVAGDAGQDTSREVAGLLQDAERVEREELERLTGGAGDDASQDGEGAAADQLTVSERNVQLIAQVCKAAFGLAATLKDREHWNLSDDEADQIANPAALVVEKYLGHIEIGPEVALLFALGASLGVRVAADRQLDKAEAAAQAKRDAEAGAK